MTRKLFYEDPMLHEFEASVTACIAQDGCWAVVLDATAFFPMGGGQPGDRGTLNQVAVTDTREQNGEIVHLCAAPLPVGQRVQGTLDWPFRLRNMQCHTGEHIFSGLAYQLFGCRNVGFHLGHDQVVVDFDRPLDAEQVALLEHRTNEALMADRETVIRWPSPEELAALDYRSKKELTGEVRIVETGGIDVCACCALHVPRSGMVGCMAVVDQVPFRGGIRLTLLFAQDALDASSDARAAAQGVARLLSVKPAQAREAVERLLADRDAREQERRALLTRIFHLRMESLPTDRPFLWMLEDNLLPDDVRRGADLLAEQTEQALVLSGTDETGYSFALCSHSTDVRPLCHTLCQALSGRGGGKPALCQGALKTSRAQIEQWLETYEA